MNTHDAARSMRANGRSFVDISEALNISLQYAYKCATDVLPKPIQPNRQRTIRHTAHNGGCSTLSGLRPVSLPRIATIDGVAA